MPNPKPFRLQRKSSAFQCLGAKLRPAIFPMEKLVKFPLIELRYGLLGGTNLFAESVWSDFPHASQNMNVEIPSVLVRSWSMDGHIDHASLSAQFTRPIRYQPLSLFLVKLVGQGDLKVVAELRSIG